MPVLCLLCCTLVLVTRTSGYRPKVDQRQADGGLDRATDQGVPESQVEVFMKTIEDILDDLEVIDAEEEKNNIDAGIRGTTRTFM